ncbi:MAG TPA: hypothetical protein EYP76_03270 [Thiomicrorhabdus sp.]|nr:hypothetical protein [Thiomicrorhabdus sp.]
MNLRVLFIGVILIFQGCIASNPKTETENNINTGSDTSLFQFEFPFISNKVGYHFFGAEEQVVLHLLKQGRYYANLKEPYRLKACKELAAVYKEDSFWQTGWLLAYSFSDKGSCITHKERLTILNELEEVIEFYQDIQWLNSAHIQTLEHITYLKARNAFLKEKESVLEDKIRQSDAENRELKTLIKELKKVEKIMNERISDDNL